MKRFLSLLFFLAVAAVTSAQTIPFYGDEFIFQNKNGGTPLKTKFGVINDSAAGTGAAATLLGFPVARSGWTYPNISYNFETLAKAYPSLEVQVTINIIPSDSTQGYPDSTTIDGIIANIATRYDQHFAPYNIIYVNAQNEMFNKKYYRLDGSSVRRYCYFLESLANLFKSKNQRFFITDGGVTGPSEDYLIYKYIKDSLGDATAAANYKRLRFTPAQQAGVDNWETTGPFVETIARYREFLDELQCMDNVGGVSLHYTFPVNDSTAIDTMNMVYAVQAFTAYSGGKQVVFQEAGLNNQSPAIIRQAMSTAAKLEVPYFIMYNGTDVGFTGKDNAFTNRLLTQLLDNGTAAKAHLPTLKGVAGILFRLLRTGMLQLQQYKNTDSTQFATFDAAGNMILKQVPQGGTGGVSGVSSSDITNWNTAYSWGNHASAGYESATHASNTFATIAALNNYLLSADANTLYVAKETGKGLSTNDYSDAEKANVAANTLASHTHPNKTLLDTYTQTEANLADAVAKKHSHANQTALDNVSGANSGDETTSSIKSKLGISVLSGSNTGDQDLSGLATIAALNNKLNSTDTTGKWQPVENQRVSTTNLPKFTGVNILPQTTLSTPASGFNLTDSTGGGATFIFPSGIRKSLNWGNVTSNSVWKFQNKSGTLADSTDVAGKVDKTTTISVNGASPQPLSSNVNLTISGGSSTATLKDVITNGYSTDIFTKFGDTSYRKPTDSTLFFGDSYTGGSGSSVTANRFSTIVAGMMNTNELNRGHAGTTLQFNTPGDSSMIEKMFLIPVKTPAYKAIVFEYGTNDAQNTGWADTASYRSSYYRIIDTCVARGWTLNDIVIVTPGYFQVQQARRLQYISVTKSIGIARNVAVADVWSLMQSETSVTGSYMSSDSLHPNDYGHLLFARSILNAYRGKHQSEVSVHGKINTNYLSLSNNPNDINPSVLNVFDTASSGGLKNKSLELRVFASLGGIGFGLNALAANTTGQFNSAFGKSALQLNTTGSNNNAFGLNALANNTTGNRNVGIGTQALQNNVAGNNNVAVGATSLALNTGSNNTALGDNTLPANTSGGSNTATGSGALRSNTTASANTATGGSALQNNTTGANNTGVGANALAANVTGTLNTAVGSLALNVSTSSNNTTVGARSLENTTSGANNTALGQFAGFINTTGSGNIFIGKDAGNNATYTTVSNRFVVSNNTTLPLLDGTMATTAAGQSLTINGVLNTQGKIDAFAAKTANYTLTANDEVIKADATSGAITQTLPTAVGKTGQTYTIIKSDVSANAVTVATTSSQTINGTTTYTLSSQYKLVTMKSDGSNWLIFYSN